MLQAGAQKNDRECLFLIGLADSAFFAQNLCHFRTSLLSPARPAEEMREWQYRLIHPLDGSISNVSIMTHKLVSFLNIIDFRVSRCCLLRCCVVFYYPLVCSY